MPISDDELTLIRRSFDSIRQDIEPASTFFYDELFRRAPELRSMFRDDLAGQGMKFMSTLSVIVDNLHAPAALAERYRELGSEHRRLGVTADQFEPLGDALIATIKDVLGDRFSPEIEAAWRTAYAELAAGMISKGGIERE